MVPKKPLLDKAVAMASSAASTVGEYRGGTRYVQAQQYDSSSINSSSSTKQQFVIFLIQIVSVIVDNKVASRLPQHQTLENGMVRLHCFVEHDSPPCAWLVRGWKSVHLRRRVYARV